jgi:pimeloyl-ACP methyl ester carboxylesterase
VRLGLVALLLALATAAWWWTADQMRDMDDGPWTALGSLGWFLGIWVVMMAAMMFPSVAPTVALYARMAREQGWTPLDIIGFSAGGYVAAEFAAAAPEICKSVTLVAPLGIRPLEGEIFDFLATTVRTHVAATVSKVDAPEFAEIYGGGMTPEQFELFEDARAETARIGWEPFMFNPSLPHHLKGIGQLPVLLVWGTDDLVAPKGLIDAYDQAVPNSKVVTVSGVGHRPEIEDPEGFLAAVTKHLGI